MKPELSYNLQPDAWKGLKPVFLAVYIKRDRSSNIKHKEGSILDQSSDYFSNL
uniref:Uncharacterized protein n=1 Tax=Brassica oleracea var. oleracea TaxID=109376 RepID=A0A0D3BZ00_BRAOL